MKEIFPSTSNQPLKRQKLNEKLNIRNEELAKIILPKIEPRKLEDLFDDNTKNPYFFEKNVEKLLVFREKERDLDKL
jgi:hypothetical protein